MEYSYDIWDILGFARGDVSCRGGEWAVGRRGEGGQELFWGIGEENRVEG